MERFNEWWNSVLAIPGASWIIYPSLLVILVLIAWYVLQMLRNLAVGGAATSEDYLGSFRKMRDEGMLGADEYKKLAGLVPIPEAVADENQEPDPTGETGQQALTEAAREVIIKAAQKRAQDDSDQQKNSDDGLEKEDDQTSES